MARSRATGALLAVLSIVSYLVIEGLHDHACTGDGCALCLVAACAHVLLAVCLGITVARPVLRLLAVIRPARIAISFLPAAVSLPFGGMNVARAVQTPVTLGVRLLI